METGVSCVAPSNKQKLYFLTRYTKIDYFPPKVRCSSEVHFIPTDELSTESPSVPVVADGESSPMSDFKHFLSNVFLITSPE